MIDPRHPYRIVEPMPTLLTAAIFGPAIAAIAAGFLYVILWEGKAIAGLFGG